MYLWPSFFYFADESKFPDALPDTDPWAYDVTWFQMEPEDAYIIRSKSAILTCRVASALKVSYILFVMLFPSKLLPTFTDIYLWLGLYNGEICLYIVCLLHGLFEYVYWYIG